MPLGGKTGKWLPCRRTFLFRISSVVEQLTVNQLVAGSNPASGDLLKQFNIGVRMPSAHT